ncbi:hypothetical protein [Archangium violaceum]
MKKTEANTTEKHARRRWTRRDWDTLLQLMQFLATIYALFTRP